MNNKFSVFSEAQVRHLYSILGKEKFLRGGNALNLDGFFCLFVFCFLFGFFWLREESKMAFNEIQLFRFLKIPSTPQKSMNTHFSK